MNVLDFIIQNLRTPEMFLDFLGVPRIVYLFILLGAVGVIGFMYVFGQWRHINIPLTFFVISEFLRVAAVLTEDFFKVWFFLFIAVAVLVIIMFLIIFFVPALHFTVSGFIFAIFALVVVMFSAWAIHYISPFLREWIFNVKIATVVFVIAALVEYILLRRTNFLRMKYTQLTAVYLFESILWYISFA